MFSDISDILLRFPRLNADQKWILIEKYLYLRVEALMHSIT